MGVEMWGCVVVGSTGTQRSAGGRRMGVSVTSLAPLAAVGVWSAMHWWLG